MNLGAKFLLRSCWTPIPQRLNRVMEFLKQRPDDVIDRDEGVERLDSMSKPVEILRHARRIHIVLRSFVTLLPFILSMTYRLMPFVSNDSHFWHAICTCLLSRIEIAEKVGSGRGVSNCNAP